MFVGAPIFAALGVASLIGMFLQGGTNALNVIPSILHRGLASYSLICIPLFILMGEVMARTSIGGKLYNLFYVWLRSEEHTSELQSLMRISYAVFCLKTKKKKSNISNNILNNIRND